MFEKIKYAWMLILLLAAPFIGTAQSAFNKPAEISVNLAKIKAPMKPVWAWFGYDEPNYTYMKDGKKLLSELSALSPVPVYVRTHSLLVSGDSKAALKWGSTNAYTEDANGNPVYNWAIIDSIFDPYIKRGMKPFAQIGFMPEALSTHPQPYRHHWKPGDPYSDIITGWAYPPKDYKKWGDLIYNWVKHSIARYGKQEVESWYWEVWNEPNGYWKGTRQEFFKLYDYAADGVKRALPTAKIGGIDIAGTSSTGAQQWLNAFIKHCTTDTNYATGKIGAPLDLLSFHAKGSPRLINGMVQMNMSPQLNDIATGFRIAAAYAQTKNIPLIIGESDPEGCAACGMATNPSNAYRNGTMYSSYTAATFARKYELEDEYGINFKGAVSWSFEFENQPWFYGFRDLATNGVDKPVLNVFRMFGKMRGNRVEAVSNRMYPLKAVIDSSIRGAQTDIGVLASAEKHTAAIMIWNYHDDDQQGPAEAISVSIDNIPSKTVTLTHYRIDNEHSNSYEAWKKMGSPQNPTEVEIAALQKAGQLQTMGEPQKLNTRESTLKLDISIPRQGVSLLKLTW
ncbi:GH39 family glycosyl hydrolase [Mucilaginibacter xinganensis]|uniref:Xylan 1,4-beta-xylosidase n=1 Tax=Mucilaginibacter xinganensis TaxID=1234841 RepID=A0A223NQ82_9SPHI|nr:beta-xylosidase [Mucilaginibacter xinganensis]ASU32059.1 xylan 1,4-beta-xylosidase [Mucilaginibacter xinganensis]